jgi:sterol desaturase/sphingolipid hydroxylase (fatty acid hydroxylase superfamily)
MASRSRNRNPDPAGSTLRGCNQEVDMSQTTTPPCEGYQPADPIEAPPLYAWPPRPIATLRWLATGLLLPWGLFFIALAVLAWNHLTPSLERMAVLEPGWIASIWLRNAALLTLVAGGLHWWLYMRRGQGREFKFNSHWLATDSRKFLWGNQAKDNMFWSLASGCTLWSLYEAVTLWLYASGQVRVIEWSEAPIYLSLMTLGVFFWSTFHFYLNHRLLHWRPLFRAAHELHHRNANTGPWSGISMHPLEHLIYFTVFILWWVVPVHPIVVILTGFYQGISPAVSHSGFDRIVLKGGWNLTAGDQFHHLHHRYFHVNFGNTPTPLDKLFGTWHDGSPEAHSTFRRALRERRAGVGRQVTPG